MWSQKVPFGWYCVGHEHMKGEDGEKLEFNLADSITIFMKR